MAESLLLDQKNDEAINLFITKPPSKEKITNAVTIWTELSYKNHADAMCWLYLCFSNGLGVKAIDKSKADEFLLRSVQLGNNFAIAFSYYLGKCGYLQNKSVAFNMLQKLADQGDIRAINTLVFYYLIDDYDAKKGFLYCTVAADKGYIAGINNLGYCYNKGAGVTKDVNKAKECYEFAASFGYASAYNNLGVFL